jgi:3-hydroxybutyryl-CoA dehydratase
MQADVVPRTFRFGDSASYSRTITAAEVEAYALLTGDNNPLHLDEEYAGQTRFGQRIVHGMLTAGLISTVIGTKLPGRGAIYLGQTLRFLKPVHLGDTITATATITHYDEVKGRMTLETACRNQRGEDVLAGEADILYRP